MQFYHYLAVGLALVVFVEARAAVRLPLDRRQHASISREPSQAPATAKADASPLPSSPAPAGNAESTGTPSRRETQTPNDGAARSTNLATTATTVDQVAETASSNVLQPSSTAAAEDGNPLPIHPKVTPAVGVAGVILLISGAVYAVIGIKNKWLYVFFSAAYLTSLAVTVLVVYLMKPPVSDAIQGTFFVAAFLSGMLFGGIALVFSDITDGLGCLLGGFCLSMWFLSLKEGGLIGSATGRAIFIGSMSVAGYALSFSHYTRTYGLMVSISFAGATITVLGIDCFSRAGWKEFWLYIWNLSPGAFPLHTDTYPITRGIRVEVAAVVLLSVFGVVSQLKLWKVVKERRQTSAAARREREQNLAREEEDIGRRVQHDFTRERTQWEATYGDKSQQQDSVIDSSLKSSPKTSMSVREQDSNLSDSVEMATLSPKHTAGLKGDSSKSQKGGPSVTVTVLEEEDEIHQIDSEGKPIPLSERTDPFAANNSNTHESSDKASSGPGPTSQSVSMRNSQGSSVSPPPEVVPLPFTIPTESEEDVERDEVDHASVSAVPDAVYDHVSDQRRSWTDRLSGGPVFKQFSDNKAGLDDQEESLIIRHVEDDRSSSIAATLDDEFDIVSLSDLSEPQSPKTYALGEQISTPDDTEKGKVNLGAPPMPGGSDDERPGKDTKSDENLVPESVGLPIDSPGNTAGVSPGTRRSLTISTNPKTGVTWSNRRSLSSPRSGMTASAVEDTDESGRQTKSSMTSRTSSPMVISKDALPSRLSKVALSYRTNEWAKHLELAEEPELDELPEPESPGVQIVYGSPEEEAVSAGDEIKEVVPTKQMSKRTSTASKTYQNSNPIRSTSNMSRQSLLPDSALGGATRAVSGAASKALRSSSTPVLAQTLESMNAGRLTSTPSPVYSSTLMSQRKTLVRNKRSTQSFTSLVDPAPNVPTALEIEREQMSLAQRRQLIQQHAQKATPGLQRRQSNWALGENIDGFNSHQPRRASGGVDPDRREAMLAGWRESMRQDGTPGQRPTKEDENRRLALISERRQKELVRQKREMLAQQRESMRDNMMRSGEMLDAHREAMRRLQAKAGRNAC